MQQHIPTADEVAEVVARIKSWQWVEPDERVALRGAVSMLQLAVREPQPHPVIDRPLRVAEVAELLRVSDQTVRAMIKSGRLPGYTLSGRKGSEYRVNESVVREFLASPERVA